MVTFFKKDASVVYAVDINHTPTDADIERLTWLFDGAKPLKATRLKGRFTGPRREMVTPWSTNAVEITQNMGVEGISRIEEYHRVPANVADPRYDPMLQRLYPCLDQKVFATDRTPDPVEHITDLKEYNQREGLALSEEEMAYLEGLSQRLGRPLTDSEVFGFSQVNSEHCRHKIFNGTFIIDGKEMPSSLFSLIKRTSKASPRGLVSAYKDNVAFVRGPRVMQFAPQDTSRASLFEERPVQTVISLKAETHNFPTTVEPFNGAATGTGGEIRDRLGGGRASLPLAGTAVYMTSYPRLIGTNRWEMMMNPRVWLYQTPSQILIKASNGASDFGNKYGQPLICGSLLTFEHNEHGRQWAYDKVIMLAGGVGYANARDARKAVPKPGQKVIVMGGDNYRIGMGGGAVSSVNTGAYGHAIELNAVQRANPEMQKRVANVIRALGEAEDNPIVSIHDHGAGGHLNCLSELVEDTGGRIDISQLPVGDKTLSYKEIVGNESQERMGIVADAKDVERIERIAQRERAPFYVVGETTGDHRFVFDAPDGTRPIDLGMKDMFGSSPKTVMRDDTRHDTYADAEYDASHIDDYVRDVLTLEAVACKDWLTNKVDRSVTGRVARQQCQGAIQLPLSDCGVVALDYHGREGIATSLGHAPQAALISPAAGSVLSIAESLTNIAGANLQKGLDSVSLSANWMWPCNNPGQDAALYAAVEACSQFAQAIGVNIPTGKDSLSMTQTYPDGKVLAPGTVIISAAGRVADITKTVSPVVSTRATTTLYYVDLSGCPLRLGGSALFQALGHVGAEAPTVTDPAQFVRTFQAVQTLVRRRQIMAMHDVSAGGLVTTLLEMTFANPRGGLDIDLDGLGDDLVAMLFAENPALVMQIDDRKAANALRTLRMAGARVTAIGHPAEERQINIEHLGKQYLLGIDYLRDVWMHASYELDRLQTASRCAAARFENYGRQAINYRFVKTAENPTPAEHRPLAAIIREKGINGDREMAYSLYAAGFDVKDIHMTDLMSGREDLSDVRMAVFCGGFSNSDVLGSAKGWASGFRWNDTARAALERFYARPDTMSLGVCNGCQLMMELGLIRSNTGQQIRMGRNASGKFESAFLGVTIPESPAIMFRGLAGSRLGIWVAHGEGRFILPEGKEAYNAALQYTQKSYPGNPNGSPRAIAGLCSTDGRHLAMMPHLERAIMPWQCAYYPLSRRRDAYTPWLQAFVNARHWLVENS